MDKEILKRIAKHFTELYSDEISNKEVGEEVIYEWWTNTAYQYGYLQDNLFEPYNEIEKEILKSLEL